jgi:outer membrane receptor protein involved in Fe transport|tara:strand:+ start:3397 stop:5982 length:2586 start_codon:yes stop_codon:yes gene_type:complete
MSLSNKSKEDSLGTSVLFYSSPYLIRGLKMYKIKKTALSVILGGFIFITSPINALALEEIIVTAQKREQNLRDVPISILAVTGDDIQDGGFSDMEDMATFLPNVYMSDSLTGQNLVIRGIGTTVANEAFEQAVAQFHDGVYYGRDNLGQNSFFDLERVEVIRGPAPIFAGQSATAGALSYYSRRPGDEWEGNISAAYGNDEELSVEAAFGGPVSDSFAIRASGRYYELGDAGYKHVLTGKDLGTKENWGARILGVFTPTDNFELMFKVEHQDVLQIGTPTEYTRCETRPALSASHPAIAPGIGALCALDAAVNGIDLNKLDGVAGSGGALDVRAAMDALNIASGATFGEPNYWGAPWSPVSRGLNTARIFNEEERRDYQADIGLVAIDWDIGGSGLKLNSITSYVEYDKEDFLDPDMSSFAIFAGHRAESFEQLAQEIRLTSSEDQRFAWMVGAYYQEHDLITQIDVHLPWLFDLDNFFSMGAVPNNPALDPRVHSAVGFGGPLVENSKWLSAFFNTTFNVTDNFRVNAGGRYVDISKDGTENPQRSLLPIGATEFEAAVPLGPPVAGKANASKFLPEIGVQWDMTADVMVYAKYSEALKAGGFVKSPPVTGRAPDPFSYDPEHAEGIEIGFKSLLFDGRLALNAAYYNTDFDDLQVTVFNNANGQFITQNAAAANSKGAEFDGRLAVTDQFTLGFSGSLGKAEYDDYDGAPCNSFDMKLAIGAAGGNPMAPCFIDGAGKSLTFSPEWSLNLQPEYRMNIGDFEVTASANMIFSDGYTLFSIAGDPLDNVDSWERIDLRIAVTPFDGQWKVAFYGRDVTDERLQHNDAYEFLSTSADLVFDANGVGRERGARYGVQLSYSF